MSTAPESISFAALTALVRSSVEVVAATEPDPVDPFRGLYLSDQAAVRLASGDDDDELDARLDTAAALLGLSHLEGCVLALCAAPELHPRYGRLYGYLHDDLTRRLPSPRLIARLLEGAGFPAPDVLRASTAAVACAPAARCASPTSTAPCRSPSAARRRPSGWLASCSASTSPTHLPTCGSRSCAPTPISSGARRA